MKPHTRPLPEWPIRRRAVFVAPGWLAAGLGCRRRQSAHVVLSTDTGFERDYTRDPYAGYDKQQRLMFGVRHRDERFPLKEWVLGIEVAGLFKAYQIFRGFAVT